MGPPRLGWDPHCHLDDPCLRDALGEVTERAARAGLSGCLVPGYGPERWPAQRALLSGQHPLRLAGALGWHPWAVPADLQPGQARQMLQQALSRWRGELGTDPTAIGEFGLDRSSRAKNIPLEAQKELFRVHLELAEQLQKPVILHLVRSDGAALELLEEFALPARGVVHSFSSHAQTVPRYAEHGLFLSFGAGILRYRKAREALSETPEHLMMFETDGPRGLEGDFSPPLGPHHLLRIVRCASEILGRSIEWCWAVHRENCQRLFSFETKESPT